MKSLKIAIMGSRGIPNHYGGFEQFAQFLARGLAGMGMEVTVYNSHKHPYQYKQWNGVKIVHCFDAEYLLGTAGQFIYDLNCIRHARKQVFDIILFLGYTSSSVWGRLFPKNAVVISNMDGLEWKRSKYSRPVQRFLQYAEKLGVKYSHHLVADSVVIQQYLKEKYNTNSSFIPYGAEISETDKEELLTKVKLNRGAYYMLMARVEPENNIAMILEGFHQSNTDKALLVIGNTRNGLGRSLVKKYGGDTRIRFAGAIYDDETLHALRRYCYMYFHGHSVGGTNPSLLEAMADSALIAAHDNPFNQSVLEDDAFYFSSPEDIRQLTEYEDKTGCDQKKVLNNLEKIRLQYNWPVIVKQYHELFYECHNSSPR